MARDRRCRGRWGGVVAATLAAVFAAAVPATARDDGPDEIAPATDGRGGVHRWRGADGLEFLYRLPRQARERTPWTMTVILHGSNLSKGWGFANHRWESFRPHDLVVSPDGTTPNGQGGHNFFGEAKDVKRLKALIEEMKEALPIERVLLYGHSQGSFFALHLAGSEPNLVQGVVAHASGLWTWTPTGPRAHHQAICFMHGTRDPVVHYGQSVGGYEALKKARYPLLRLRSLEGWNHWPAEHNGAVPHTSQQLAWCDAVTATDPNRVERALDLLAEANQPGEHDFAALYDAASRIAERSDLPEPLRARAGALRDKVAALAERHAKALGTFPTDLEPDGKAWMGHLGLFLRHFAGTPACEALRERLGSELDGQQKRLAKAWKAWWKAREDDDVPEAFDAGARILRDGFLTPEGTDPDLRKTMDGWAKDAKGYKLPRKAVAAYQALVGDLDKGMKNAWKDYEKVNSTFPK